MLPRHKTATLNLCDQTDLRSLQSLRDNRHMVLNERPGVGGKH